MKIKTRVRIKYCGITSQESLDAAVISGADALGFVLWKGSKRAIDINSLAVLKIPAFISRVGLFVDQNENFIYNCLPYLDILQFHGNEPPDECSKYNKPWIKALSMHSGIDIYEKEKIYAKASGLLIDTYEKDTPGGTGKTFDWSLVSKNIKLPLILAGGLNANNVKKAIRIVKPYAVDVSSGVEISLGIKDIKKMMYFYKSVNNSFNNL
ncbi:N-(5'-phosphoribosyl)anthranilate isomerase [Candidatus Johnevansia muelleri]|uniref:N-(5'-phosphoribosyl)anthranilate isomerase n=1 Tax=Candidatus Johnevansia muelleri TaxID=1495769 RepID=A0A078KBA8_9GAMM|nr:N-(5'-phosphoribosyl)anthranilate isomerase [Candidatus Evansia muelleri]